MSKPAIHVRRPSTLRESFGRLHRGKALNQRATFTYFSQPEDLAQERAYLPAARKRPPEPERRV
jgi:hypothetical protein